MTGKPCKHGHVSMRYVVSKQCLECNKEKSKKWYSENTELAKDRSEKSQKGIRLSKAGDGRALPRKNRTPEQAKSAISTGIEKSRALLKADWIKNRDARLQYKRENMERSKALAKQWRERNPNKNREYVAGRRARKLLAQGEYTAQDVARILTLQKFCCAECRADTRRVGFHVDHIVPLAKGGSNNPSNLQILCPSCNSKKGAKDPYEWARLNGRLV